MSVKFGDVDVIQIIDNEYRSKLASKVLDRILSKNPQWEITPEEIETLKDEVEKELQKKYPNMGIKLTK